MLIYIYLLRFFRFSFSLVLVSFLVFLILCFWLSYDRRFLDFYVLHNSTSISVSLISFPFKPFLVVLVYLFYFSLSANTK